MAAKKKIDGRTKAGKAALAKALEKVLKGKMLDKKPKKGTKTRTVKHDGGKVKVKRKKQGRPAIAAHLKIAKKLKEGAIVAVKSREGIVGEVSHYIDDGKKVVIRRGIEVFAETQIVIPTTKLRAATQFEALAYIAMIELLENLEARLAAKAKEALKAVDAQPAIDPAFNVVETAEQVQSEAELSDAEAIKVVEDVLKASQSDLVGTPAEFPYSA